MINSKQQPFSPTVDDKTALTTPTSEFYTEVPEM